MMTTHFIQTYKSTDPKEQLLNDLDAEIKETKLTIGTLGKIKKTITDNSSIISETLCLSLSEVTVEPTFPFPEFIHWAVKNYVPSTKQILSADGTRVICTINFESLRKEFFLPIPNPTQNPMQFSKESSLDVIKALNSDQVYTFMSKMFRPDISPSNYAFPYAISLFIEKIQVVFALLR